MSATPFPVAGALLTARRLAAGVLVATAVLGGQLPVALMTHGILSLALPEVGDEASSASWNRTLLQTLTALPLEGGDLLMVRGFG